MKPPRLLQLEDSTPPDLWIKTLLSEDLVSSSESGRSSSRTFDTLEEEDEGSDSLSEGELILNMSPGSQRNEPFSEGFSGFQDTDDIFSYMDSSSDDIYLESEESPYNRSVLVPFSPTASLSPARCSSLPCRTRSGSYELACHTTPLHPLLPLHPLHTSTLLPDVEHAHLNSNCRNEARSGDNFRTGTQKAGRHGNGRSRRSSYDSAVGEDGNRYIYPTMFLSRDFNINLPAGFGEFVGINWINHYQVRE